jgi:F-type H+-transporting ATPase subunit delta
VKERIAAKRYAGALVELAQEARALDRLLADLSALGDAVERVPALMRGLGDERVAIERRMAAAGSIAAALGLGPFAHDAVLLLLRKRRVALLPLIVRDALSRVMALKRMSRATATVADARLAETLSRRIEEILSALIAQEVRCDVDADPALLGGFVLHLGDRRYDCSVAGKLDRMVETLMRAGA